MLERGEVTSEGYMNRFFEFIGDVLALSIISTRLLLKLKEEVDKLRMK